MEIVTRFLAFVLYCEAHRILDHADQNLRAQIRLGSDGPGPQAWIARAREKQFAARVQWLAVAEAYDREYRHAKCT